MDGNGLRLHYLDWGGGDDKLVVFIHGGRDHARTWDDVIALLPPEWHAIAPDLRGHGDSQWAAGGNYALWEYVSDIDALVRTVGNSQRLILVGHSLGGAAALQYAGARPNLIRAVIAIEPFGLGRGASSAALLSRASQEVMKITPSEGRIGAHVRLVNYLDSARSFDRRSAATYKSIAEAGARLRATNPRMSPAVAQRMARYGVRELPNGGYAWKFDNRVRMASPFAFEVTEAREVWARIAAPVLLINGSDRLGSSEASDGFLADFRDVQVQTLANASHWVQQEQPGAVADLLRDFVLAHPGR